MRFYATEENVKITGRTLFVDNVRYLGYSGSSISFTFVGKWAKAVIWSDTTDWVDELKGQIAVYINEEELPTKRICLNKEEGEYLLYQGEEVKQVTVTIMKYSEAAFGKCGIRSIETDSLKLCPPPAAKERKIEIIGDSITCGYGVEAENELVPFHTATENPTKSYSLLTAKALNADANLVSWSGNGIISGFVEETATEPLEKWLMPEVYQYTDLSCSDKLFGDDESKWERWDFHRFVPDLILINLGTNDCSWCKDIQERKNQYRDRYVTFLEYVRSQNPRAKIICMLGTMDQRVIKELEEAVSIYMNKQKDNAVYFLPLPAQKPEDGYGADWHPCPLTHRITADLVVSKAKEIMNW